MLRIARIAASRKVVSNFRRFSSTPRLLAKKKETKRKTDLLAEAERYSRIDHHEHILLRPDTYIGSVIPAENESWLYSHESGRMELTTATFPPGLVKIFDEILVNAADNKQRDPTMDELRVTVDSKKNEIRVWNNGHSLPIVVHPKENLYIPTLIFGSLFTSSNYDDSELKTVGGRNGYGAKLCNIYSSKFTVETGNKGQNLRFRQTWSDNMNITSEPEIISKCKEDFTEVTFSPDLKKFGLANLTEDVVRVLERRTVDMAGTLPPGVRVSFNGKRIPVDGFKEYAKLFADDVCFFNSSSRWKVAVARSTNGFQQVSFVNNIFTPKGGNHVEHVADKILSTIKTAVEEKLRGSKQVRPSLIKNHVLLLVNSTIENPSFDSQTKVALCTLPSKFGSTFDLNSTALREWAEASGLIDAIIQELRTKRVAPPSKVTKALQVVPKLEDANLAGTAKGRRCTLIVTEGDSAKAFAIAGLEKIGRDLYGVFPIRGKLVNVCEMTRSQLKENAEISNLMKILGLRFGVDYSREEEFSTLRYGEIMILADQDEDGSHIKGLLLNFLCSLWPELVARGFVSSFRTPLIKAKRGSEVLSFYSAAEFKKWAEEHEDSKEFDFKYYKGLGTSTSAEAKEYFSDLDRHVIKYKLDGKTDLECLKKVFGKNGSNERKKWIAGRKEADENDSQTGESTVSNFVNSEMIKYSILDLKRSIPSVVDGLKPSQRKILHSLLQRNERKEVKVNQLAGSVSMSQAYHHGEESLVETIVRMSQNYVGSNNLPLLKGIGQFGTRHAGGEDAARGRYIYTQLNPITRLIFPRADDSLLNLVVEEGAEVEPFWYCPVIPLVLVNGAQGIATGWATTVHPHRTKDVTENVRRIIDGTEKDDVEEMMPHWEGFTGTVEAITERTMRYRIEGVAEVVASGKNNISVAIQELPPGIWTNSYKKRVLLPLLRDGHISEIHERHTEKSVHFVISMKKSPELSRSPEARAKLLKLVSVISANSMVLFDPCGSLRTYSSTAEILFDHFGARRELYAKRLSRQLTVLEAQRKFAENQLRFVTDVSNGRIRLGRSRNELEDELGNEGFQPNPVMTAKGQQADWSYLLEIPLLRLTNEEIARLETRLSSLDQQVAAVRETSWQEAWHKELNVLEKEL